MQERTDRHFRLGPFDYEDYVEEMANRTRVPGGDNFEPMSPKAGYWLSSFFVVFCDEMVARGEGYNADGFSMSLFSYGLSEVVKQMVAQLIDTRGWENTLAGSWYTAAKTLEQKALSAQVMTCTECFCNYWLRQELRRSKLLPMLDCGLIALGDDDLADLDKLDSPARRDAIFDRYPAIVTDPLYLARLTSIKACSADEKALFTYGFMIPLFYASSRDMDWASKKAGRLAAEAVPELTGRYYKVANCIGRLYEQAAARFFRPEMPWLLLDECQDLCHGADLLSELFVRRPEYPSSYQNLLNSARGLHRLAWLEFRGDAPAGEAQPDWHNGKRQVEKVVFFSHKYPESTVGGSIESAYQVVLERRDRESLLPEAVAVVEILRAILAHTPVESGPNHASAQIVSKNPTGQEAKEELPVDKQTCAKPKKPPKYQGSLEL